ncbi:hypothetical protein B0H63DRAFT_483835 [Podospora didyma]|uniref:Uncharacterized protein n=1 Tax=Podospora didyma TaxID=330526 RepID=A0AAE0K9F8_9PEZI|nr:hypothetical protein B0H63DRAFT_483835 [Podospora didyma]
MSAKHGLTSSRSPVRSVAVSIKSPNAIAMALLSANPRVGRSFFPVIVTFLFLLILYTSHANVSSPFLDSIQIHLQPTAPKYKPLPTWTPPPISDPFPLLATTDQDPPPIPHYNVPSPNLHARYGLEKAPPLFIGFTRQWPMLLQAVVSYITAGWPPSTIYVIENTGVHNKNKDGKLSLQNQFYLNHTTLKRLGVNVIQTPVLLTFSQMQNSFLSVAYNEDQPYYFYSHQDILVYSFENGKDTHKRPSDREWEFYDDEEEDEMMNPPAAGQPGYKTIYENCLKDLQTVRKKQERWGFRFYQYDHLTLVNREAMEAVGGWDSMIPYYNSDCDLNGRMKMGGWTMKHRRVGIINDVSSNLDDLEVLYRNPQLKPSFTDPNPTTPVQVASDRAREEAKLTAALDANKTGSATSQRDLPAIMPTDPLEYFQHLNKIGLQMGEHKYRKGNTWRNTWQSSQRGGIGEPYYYDPAGFARAFEILTDAGRDIFREKWGHYDCDLDQGGTALSLGDQWRVEKDYNDKKRRD